MEWFFRHCERSEAIQITPVAKVRSRSFWIASSAFGLLAMTGGVSFSSAPRTRGDGNIREFLGRTTLELWLTS
jgi:hypothetical protein